MILDAAEGLFARKGLEAATIKEIGAESGLTPALLYYYFGDKEELYRAVLGRIVKGLVAEGGAALDAAASPPEAIRALVSAQVRFLLAHPSAPRLLIREMLDHEARRAHALVLQVSAGLFQRLCTLIEAGQRSGRFRRDVEPRFAAVSTVAQVAYFLLARPAITIFFGLGPGGITPALATEFGRHAGDFAVHALSDPEPRS
jgi:AcrR family transcriptional regulator